MPQGLSKNDRKRFEEKLSKISRATDRMLGYPLSRDFDYSEILPLMNYGLNNIGDPRIESTASISTKEEENEVVDFFADIFRAPKNNYWGYVTNGGTEGNLYALYLARELYPGAMVYFSESTHYSVQKNLHLLNIDNITIKCQDNDEMDYDDLEAVLSQHRHRPAIVFANIGTTMTEAKDNVATITGILKKLAIRQHYIHADAALAGTYTALVEPHHPFDFEDGADSISISGHKFIGSPIPCGVVIVKKNYKERIGQLIPYIGTLDTTITGSRNGHTPMFIWYAIKKWGKEGFLQRAEHGMELAKYTRRKLNSMGWKAWMNPNSLTVVIDKPADEVIAKWQIATQGDMAHIICMPGVTKEQIDLFLADMMTFYGSRVAPISVN
jgi:histidine decarboxylase